MFVLTLFLDYNGRNTKGGFSLDNFFGISHLVDSGLETEYSLFDCQNFPKINKYIHKVEETYVSKYKNTIYFLNTRRLKYNFLEKYKSSILIYDSKDSIEEAFNLNSELFEELAQMDSFYESSSFKSLKESEKVIKVVTNYFRKLEIINFKLMLSCTDTLDCDSLNKNLERENLEFVYERKHNSKVIKLLSEFSKNKKELSENLRRIETP